MDIQQFDYSIDIEQALLWQRNTAEALTSLIQSKQRWYDENVTRFLNQWYDDVFNLDTANDFGLSVWSIILDLPLFQGVNVDPPGKPIFGFGTYNQNFENGNFSNINQKTGLTTEEKRLLLKLRYFSLATRDDIPDINSFLAYVFEPYGTVYVLDGEDMTMTYVFSYSISENLLEIMLQYKLLPKPAGVLLKTVILTKPIFGFGTYNQNFENGNFYA
jgi:hypothetical protein